MTRQGDILIERLRAAREHLDRLVPQAPADKYIYPNWTIKEYLDHLSGWDDAVVEALSAHAKGEPIPQSAALGINAYNAETVTTRESISLEHTQLEFNRSREAVIQAIKNMPDEKYGQPLIFPWGEAGTVNDFIEIFVEHDEEHAEHLEKWLKNTDQVVGEH